MVLTNVEERYITSAYPATATDPIVDGFGVAALWPNSAPDNLPEHLPDQVKAILSEADDAYRRSKAHAAGLLFGKTLDVAIKKFDPTLKGSLHSRIDQLGKSGRIAPDLANWAMTLKGIRNDATHEEEPLSLEDIQHMADATRLIMEYLFTMPERMRRITAGTKTTT